MLFEGTIFCTLVIGEVLTDVVLRNGTLVFVEDATLGPRITAESRIIGPIRLWHICGMALTFVMIIVITVCCCVDVRIPRTRQQIDANYQTRKLNDKYGERFVEFRKDKLMSNLNLYKPVGNHPRKSGGIEEVKDRVPNPSRSQANDRLSVPLTTQSHDILRKHREARPSQRDMIRTLSSIPTNTL